MFWFWIQLLWEHEDPAHDDHVVNHYLKAQEAHFVGCFSHSHLSQILGLFCGSILSPILHPGFMFPIVRGFSFCSFTSLNCSVFLLSFCCIYSGYVLLWSAGYFFHINIICFGFNISHHLKIHLHSEKKLIKRVVLKIYSLNPCKILQLPFICKHNVFIVSQTDKHLFQGQTYLYTWIDD